MPDHNECHILPSMSGHIQSTDCWCEAQGYWITDSNGEPLFVVDHYDLHDPTDAQGMLHTRSTILVLRDNDATDWVTHFLNRFDI